VTMEDGPFIVDEPPLISGGVDFLGLRQTNLDLMAEAIPGINNVTRYIRPFSLMAWITWKYRELAVDNPPTDQKEAFTNFRERVETLFTWSHWLHGRRDLPGMGRFRPPIQTDGKASLGFRAWQRQADNTSYFAAVQYGPASKSNSGLGILESRGARLPLVPTSEFGEKLAKSLEERLRTNPIYNRTFSDLSEGRASESDALSLYSAWSIGDPTDAERSVFRSALSPNSNADPISTRRKEIIDAIRTLVTTHEQLSVQRLRSLLAARPGSPIVDLVEARWAVLQLRQAQRLGFEVLFHNLEALAIKQGAKRAEVTTDILTSISSGGIGPTNKVRIGDWIEWATSRWATPQLLLAEFERELDDSPMVLALKAHDLVSSDQDGDQRMATSIAFTLLLIIAYSVSKLSLGSTETINQLMSWGNGAGSRNRFSLSNWAEIVEQNHNTPVREFIDSLLFDELLSRHVFTASRRADGSSNRLRIAYDGDRWTTFVSKPAAVSITPDRLSALVSLMIDCNLLSRSQIVADETV
jgi:hypothetical protein